MILALNLGNSSIAMGVYEPDALLFSTHFSANLNLTDDEYAVKLHSLLQLHGVAPSEVGGAILGSVVPALTQRLKAALQRLCPGVRVMTVGPGLKSGLPIRIDDPAQLGAELLCGCVAAREIAAPPLVMVHVDTAISMMAVDRQGQLCGGAILPGPQLSLDALVRNTAQLPQVEWELPASVLGASTVASLQAGCVLGYAALLDGLAQRFVARLGADTTFVATGLLPQAIRGSCSTPMLYRPTLVLDGLYAVWKRNRK